MLAASSLIRACASILIAGTIAWGQEGADQAELKRRIERLEKQNETLRASYAQARIDADKAKSELIEIRNRLEALGGAALGASEDRLIQAVIRIKELDEKCQALEKASVSLCVAVVAYMKQAVSEDGETRKTLESAMRYVDSLLGIKPKPVLESTGNLAQSLVLSIDSESGLIVLNAGKTAQMQVGMPIVVTRGAQTIGEAIITDVRKNVSGALIQKLQEPTEPVRVGDSASVKTNN